MGYDFNVRKIVKVLVVTLCAGLLLFGYVFYSVYSGGAFTAFRAWCMTSNNLAVVIGQFRKTELLPFGFFEKSKGETGSAGFTARIVGANKTVNADVTMKRQGNKWEIEQINIDKQVFNSK